jgi:polar amino acid transport system substrate-binding protein
LYNISRILAVLIAVLFLTSSTGQLFAQDVTACVDSYPPYHVLDEATGEWSGINVENMKQVADRAGLQLKFTSDIPFKRCLVMMKLGSADLMSGLLFDADRASYMELIPYRDYSTKLFLIKSPDISITSFSDLDGLKIGTMLGHKYFPEFDDAQDRFTKIPVPEVEQLIAMLANGRIDAVIISETHFLGLQNSNRKSLEGIRIAKFFYNAENRVHFGVSRQGQAYAFIEEIKRAVRELKEEGVFEDIIRKELGTM